MAMMAANSLFVDTNVLVYTTIPQSPFYQIDNEKLEESYQSGIDIWVSRQILRELMAALTRPQLGRAALPVPVVIREARFFQDKFQIAEDNAVVTENLLTLLTQVPIGGKHIHDANIVATMQTYGITHLLTHNVADFTRFSQYITVLPL